MMELLVTAAVTVIGFAALLGLHLATMSGNAQSSRSAEAVAVCQDTMEHLRSLTISGMTQELTGSAGTTLPIDVTLSTTTGRAGATFARRAIVEELTATSVDLVRIRVEVSWTDDGAVPGSDQGVHDHVVSLELVRTRQEAL